MTSRQRVLVCGATGFIGRNTIEHFSRRKDIELVAIEHEKPSFDCPNVEWITADLTRQEDVAHALQGIDIVIQAAATTSGAGDIINHPYIHTADNAVMNSHIFRAAYDQNVNQVVFFSCTVMYPSSKIALREEDFTGEIAPHYFGVGWTKVYLEKMAEFYAGLGRTKFTVLRHSNIYGPHDKFDLERSHMFGATVTKVMTAQDGPIVVWGEGEESRDLLYVNDLIDCVERAMERQDEPFDLYNIGYGEAFPIKEVVRRIIAASGQDLKIEFDRTKPTLKTSLFLDCSRAQAALEWKPTTNFNEGIRTTLEWYRAIQSGLGSTV
jgi:nucleoside-diphosphate-sugar epimerase